MMFILLSSSAGGWDRGGGGGLSLYSNSNLKKCWCLSKPCNFFAMEWNFSVMETRPSGCSGRMSFSHHSRAFWDTDKPGGVAMLVGNQRDGPVVS